MTFLVILFVLVYALSLTGMALTAYDQIKRELK